MNKLKKLGVSALAGSLVAVAANAGELTVAGSAILSYTSEDNLNQSTGNNLGMQNNISFTGTGEVNGLDVTYYNAFSDTGTITSSQLVIGMGDMGSITFDQGVGANGISAFDDKTPYAWEEAWDGMTGGVTQAAGGSVNVLTYRNTISGVGLNLSYDPATGDTDTSDGNFSGAGVTGSSWSAAITLPALVDGLDAGVGIGTETIDNGTTTATDKESWVAYANYTYGPLTVGYNQLETRGGAAGAVMNINTGMGAVLSINENLSVGIAQHENEFKKVAGNADVTQESTAIAVAYTMGGATLAIQNNEQDNAGGTVGAAYNESRTEINLSLAF